MKAWYDIDTAFFKYASDTFEEEMMPFVLMALRNGTTAGTGTIYGKDRFPLTIFAEKLQAQGYSKFADFYQCVRFARDGSDVCINQKPNGTYIFIYRSSTIKELKWLSAAGENWLEPVEKKPDIPAVYGFSIDGGRYAVRKVGELPDDFIRDNYDSEVGQKYDRSIVELKSKSPSGRLVLLEGEPGCGKTHLIRAMVGSLSNSCWCIIVPPSLLDKLAGPEFISTLISQRDFGMRMVLILEDADDCLIAREQNVAAKSSLAALLNMSDGILGAALDICVVVTTNQELDAIDAAILRPGRLLERIHVGRLHSEKAESIAKRLGANISYTERQTLAQVYEDAREVAAK